MSESTPTRAAEKRNAKEARLAHPSGFLYLTKRESMPIIIDALLDLLPGREFNKSELANHAGVIRQTVGNYIELLLELNIIEEVPNTNPRRYRVAESDVIQELFTLNSALNSAGE